MLATGARFTSEAERIRRRNSVEVERELQFFPRLDVLAVSRLLESDAEAIAIQMLPRLAGDSEPREASGVRRVHRRFSGVEMVGGQSQNFTISRFRCVNRQHCV